MTQTISVWLGASIIYVYGTVNGEPTTFTLAGDGIWEAITPRAPDDKYDLYIEAYSAVGLEATLNITRYYGFRPPKTNWTKNDFYNPEDYNRQAGNIEHVANVTLPTLAYSVGTVTIPPTEHAANPKQLPARLNALEDGLTAIEESGVPLPPEWQPGKTWEGGDKPDYTDANRWEGNVKAVYEMAQKIYVRWRPAGTFAAGQTNILPRKVM